MAVLDRYEYADECKRRALNYIHKIRTGEILVGKLERLAVERHLTAVERSEDPDYAYLFDENAADRVFQFFSLLRHSKSKWAGEQFILADWQAFIVWELFGWRRRDDGTRRYRVAYIQIARKNGKSTLASGIALYLLFFDGERGAEVYAAATKRDQAKIVFKESVNMINASAKLRKIAKVYGGSDPLRVIYEKAISKFEPLGADADTLDGLNPNACIVDELHKHKSRALWEVLNTAFGAREQPLLFAITTAGNDMFGVCREQRDYAERIVDGTLPDPEYFAFVCEIDKEHADRWTEEKYWRSGNPNLGVSVKVDDLRTQVKRATHLPAAQNEVRQLRLNMWVSQSERWIDVALWDECPQFNINLDGRVCFGGLDLSSTRDVSAFVLLFPPFEDGQPWAVKSYFYLPEDEIKQSVIERRVPYDQWVQEGWITATPGNVIDYDYIRDDIAAAADRYDLREVGYDPWNSTQIITQLEGSGLEMVKMRQGAATLHPPINQLEILLTSKSINVSDNPVLRWMASNVELSIDKGGGKKLDRQNARQKIDGIAALIMALGRAMAGEVDSQRSRYESENMTTIGA